MENLTQWWVQVRTFLFQIRTLFRFPERTGEASPLLPSCALVSCCWICISIPEYAEISWKCLNKLFWLCQGSGYAWSSYMFDKLLNMPPVLNKPGFWIWHGLYMQGLRRVPNMSIMAPYASIIPEYALMLLNMPDHGWMLLNVPEHAWTNCSDYASVLNMPRHSYNNINHVTNVTILEFLSSQFVHPGALLPFYLFLTRVRT